MPDILSLAPVLAATALSGALLHARCARRRAELACSAERAALRDLVRLVRLTAGDLRSTAVGLLGRAQTSADPERGYLLSTQAALLDMTEALLRQTDTPGADHYLREEAVRLRPVVDFVIAQVSCQLNPGRRAWRVADSLHGIELMADRRALHQIVLRVLTSAALATKDGDWITISGNWSADVTDGGWTLTVEDEGAGLPIEATRCCSWRDTRGFGVGLMLANTLMQAHGGELTVQSAPSVGTRVALAFPAARVVAGVPTVKEALLA